MTQLSIKVDGELVRKGLQNLADEIPKVGRRQIYDTMVRIRTRMRKPGQKPTYPIRWDSAKQRRAFFATDGFGRGIPTKRTGAYQDSWTISPRDKGYVIENDRPYTKYVGGDAYGVLHSGVHAGRYELLRDVADDEVQKLPDDVEKEIVMVARRNGL